eukprot:tig00000850_g4789.t1
MRRAVDGHLPLLVALGGSLLMVWRVGDIAAGALGSALTAPGKAGRALTDGAERFWHWLKVAVVIAAAVVAADGTPLEPGVKLERANAVSMKKAKRTLALEVPVAEDTEKVAFNKRKTYKAIREGQLLPTDSYVSRLRRSKAKKARLDSGDSSSSS